MSSGPGPGDAIVGLIPVFNDWKATGLLLEALDRELTAHLLQLQVLLVDDGSSEPPPADYLQNRGPGSAPASNALPVFQSLTKIEILELRRNLGHQRAIAISLAYIQANEPCRAVLIMDGDGEDDPCDVPRLLEHYHKQQGRTVVFAQRTQRSESLVFRGFHALYRGLHRLLTGQKINVGSFSVLPFEAVDRLVAVTELWNHYASAVFRARLPTDAIPTRRAVRLCGRPHMSFVGLVIHGLSSIAPYGDVVGVRMLLASVAIAAAALLGLLTVVVIRLATDRAIPGWATNAFGLLLIILFQAITSSVLFLFIVLNNRLGASFLPVRDYSYFILKKRRLACRE